MSLNVAKYHLGKVKRELMQPASMPFQPISFRQAKHELMQPAVSPLGNTWPVGQPSGVLQGFMVHCIIVVMYSADCCRSVALLCSQIIADSWTLSSLPFLFLVRVSILQVSSFHWISFSVTVQVSRRTVGGSCFPGLPWIPPSSFRLWHPANL